jgi:hypothetical protein
MHDEVVLVDARCASTCSALFHSSADFSLALVNTYFLYVFILRAMLLLLSDPSSAVSAPGQYSYISSYVVRPTRIVSKVP